MKIIKKGEHVESEYYGLCYYWNDSGPGHGFSFDCDKEGNVFPFTNEAAQENYDKCVDGTYEVTLEGVVTYYNNYYDPPVGKCTCGREVVLAHFTNACDCGRDYNTAGHLLAPRSHWGEETGEHPADIARIP